MSNSDASNIFNRLNILNNEGTSSRSLLEKPQLNTPSLLSHQTGSELKSKCDRYAPLSTDHSVLKYVDLNESVSIEESFDDLFLTKEPNESASVESLGETKYRFKIELQKDLVCMLYIMKNEYIKRLGATNEHTIQAIDAHSRAQEALDALDKSQ